MAAPNQHYMAKEIVDYLRDNARNDLSSELGLVDCMSGSLDQFPSGQALAARAPALFLAAQDCVTETVHISGILYAFTYTIRAVMVQKIVEGQHVETNRMKIQRIGDQILENYRFHNPAPSGGLAGATVDQIQILSVSIEYRPPEDQFVVSLQAQLMATAMTIVAKVLKQTGSSP